MSYTIPMRVRVADGITSLVLVIILGAAVLALYDVFRPGTIPAPATAASAATLYDDFDSAKKNRQIDWCEHHGGVPTMTFTRVRSNVLCLKPEAIIALPEGP